MQELYDNIDAFVHDYFSINVPAAHPTDVIEIIIISIFFYNLLIWVKRTKAWLLFRGVLFVVAFFIVAAIFQMSTILWLGEKLLNVALVMVVIVFQPELRKALTELGRYNIFSYLSTFVTGKNVSERFSDKTINDIVTASFTMGAVKTGALIVIEKEMALTDIERTGIEVDAVLTRQLLINIFEKNTPLHDGAVIVRGNRVVSATCYLPLSEDMDLSKDFGTRHRAAVGMTEVSDSFVIIVSEETGRVSVAQNGVISTGLTDDDLRERLKEFQLYNISDDDKSKRAWYRGLFVRRREENNEDKDPSDS